MKTHRYAWTDEYYLLHLQFDNPSAHPFEASVTRHFVGGHTKREEVVAIDGMLSHRIMVSRSHPKETDFVVEYPESLVLELYELDDRAYYPSKPVYKG